MAITGLTVALDRRVYSRYERDYAVVTATIQATGTSLGGAEVTLSILRDTPWQNGSRMLSTRTVTLDSSGAATAQFDLGLMSETATDASGKALSYKTARFSSHVDDYRVLVQAGNVIGWALFTVVPVTPETMRSKWMRGLPLISRDVLGVILQPQAVTGVQVVSVSGLRTGAYTLALAVSSGPVKRLAFGGGSATTLNLSTPTQAVLYEATGKGYILVRITPSLLPDSSVSESLAVDQQQMSDNDLVSLCVAAANLLQGKMGIKLEPHRIISRTLAEIPPTNRPPTQDYDEIGIPLDYRRPRSTASWPDIQLPYHGVQKLVRLMGYLNQTQTLDIEPDWYSVTEQSGELRLVPSSNSILGWQFLGPVFYSVLMTYDYIPDFWNYDLIAGLRDMPQELIEWVGMRASIPALAQAAQARYGGVGSYSVGRDGVSESRSVQGLYGQLISEYRALTGMTEDGREPGIARLRDRYCGVRMVVL
jgi:hypothetical protein